MGGGGGGGGGGAAAPLHTNFALRAKNTTTGLEERPGLECKFYYKYFTKIHAFFLCFFPCRIFLLHILSVYAGI